VAEIQAERVLEEQRPLLDNLHSWAAWDAWRLLILQISAKKVEHCPLAALTSQFPKNDPAIRALVADLFETWQAHLADGLRTMQARGALDATADPRRLALAVLTALQGGMAMAQSTGSLHPLEVGLDVALDHLRTFATGDVEAA
jgi:hypothetical protein